jgi:hypothetical protein
MFQATRLAALAHGGIERILLVFLLGLGWFWQEHQHARVVSVYLTTATTRPGADMPTMSYPAGVRSVCVYLVYADSRPGTDTYSYRFSRGSLVFFRDVVHRTDVAHGVALDCFDTGGALLPGSYDVTLLLDGNAARTMHFTVGSQAVTH